MLSMLRQRNGHLPASGLADPGWGQRQAWQMEGADPSVSLYDVDYGASGSNLDRRVHGGVLTIHELLPPGEPTMTRVGRVSAEHVTLPAARFFQSYTGAGTGRDWSAGAVASVPRRLSTSSQRSSAWGAAELHPATTYDPFPSPASLYPKVV